LFTNLNQTIKILDHYKNKLPTIPAKRFKFLFIGSSTGSINSALNLGRLLLLNLLDPE